MIENSKYIQLNEILNYISELDDSYREIKIEESSKSEIIDLLRIYTEYGDIVWRYLIDEEIISKPDEFYYQLSSFALACDSARYHLENLNNV